MSARGCILVIALLCLARLGPAVAVSNGTHVTSAHIVEVAREYLLRKLQAARPDVERLELVPVGKPAAAGWPAPSRWDDAHVKVALDGAAGSLLRTRTTVRVRLLSADGWHTVPVWFSVRALRSVLVAQRHLGAHEPPSASDFSPRDLDVAPLPGIPARSDVDLKNLRMRCSVFSGHVLLQRDLEPVPEIQRGQEVAVTVHVGAVAIETSAVALGEARTGELVSLRNPNSNERYFAQVVGQGQAVLQ